MSSHHIVREKQEPALLIIDLEGFHSEHLGQLLEWSPSIFVTESAYDAADSLGIKIDFIVGSQEERLTQPRTQVIPSGVSTLTSALNYLVQEKFPAVNVISGNPNISDYLPYCEQINIVILAINKRIFMVKSGFKKWKPAGETIEILSETETLDYTGLQPVGSQSFETRSDGFYSLNFREPFIFIAESL